MSACRACRSTKTKAAYTHITLQPDYGRGPIRKLAYAPHRIAVGGICLPAFMRHVHEAPSVLTKKNVPSFVELGGTSAGSACAGQSSSGSPWSA